VKKKTSKTEQGRAEQSPPSENEKKKFLVTNIDLLSHGHGLARLVREHLSKFGKDLKIYVEKTHPHRRIRNGTIEAMMYIEVQLHASEVLRV
jgi:hypothetical protein